MSDNKLTDERGLYQLPDEPEPPPLQGSVSAPVSALGRADAPQEPSAAAEAAQQLADWTEDFVTYRGGWSDKMMEIVVEQFAHDLDAFAAARVAEAVAAERARWYGVAFEVVSHTFFSRNEAAYEARKRLLALVRQAEKGTTP
jgi:hypothetical protein